MLEIHNLSISFKRHNSLLTRQRLSALSDISFSVQPGEIVALVGASGAGKSLLAHALLGILPSNAELSGSFTFKGQKLSYKQIKKLRGKEIALIPQSVSYLNPLTRVKKQVHRAARLSGKSHNSAKASCNDTFSRYQLADQVKNMFPFQISGGMARRVLTATATCGMADLIIADEPTTGLDVKVAQQSLNHLKELADQGKGVIIITHDLENGVNIADTLVVLHHGTTLEITPTSSLHDEEILHPYTRALWHALPQNGFITDDLSLHSDDNNSGGCCFACQCHQAADRCLTHSPIMTTLDNRHVRCNHAAC